MIPRWIIILATAVGYLLLVLIIGLVSGRRSTKTTEGFVAGDRSLGFIVLYFMLGASIFSAFAFLGGPGWAYSRGAAAFYILAYGVLDLVPWYFFGPRVARLGREFGYVTQAELFAHRFRSPAISVILALISVAAFIPYLTLQMSGAGYVFNVLTEGRIPTWLGAAITYGVVVLYVFQSGVVGVGWTNAFQGMFMMVLAWWLGIYLPAELYGGVQEMFSAIADAKPQMLLVPGLNESGERWTWGGYTSAVLISAIGFSLWPHYFMRIYTARDDRTLKRTIVWYRTFQIFLVPILFIGFAGILSFPDVTPADAILPTVVTSLELPPIAVGLFCAGALAASMSTGDAILHSGASILVRDLWKPLTGGASDDRAQRRAIRTLVVLLGGIAYYFAGISDASLVFLLLLSYGAIAQIAPPLLATFFWPRATSSGVIAGLVVGTGIVILLNVFPWLQWQDIHPGIWGLAANFLTLVSVSLLTPPMDIEHVNKFVVA